MCDECIISTNERVVQHGEVLADAEGEQSLAEDPVQADHGQDDQRHDQVHHGQVDKEGGTGVVKTASVVDHKDGQRVADSA